MHVQDYGQATPALPAGAVASCHPVAVAHGWRFAQRMQRARLVRFILSLARSRALAHAAPQAVAVAERDARAQRRRRRRQGAVHLEVKALEQAHQRLDRLLPRRNVCVRVCVCVCVCVRRQAPPWYAGPCVLPVGKAPAEAAVARHRGCRPVTCIASL